MVNRLNADSKFPYILGADVAGVIERAPRGTATFRPGDRVFGMARTNGTYAEFGAVPIDDSSQPVARIRTVDDLESAGVTLKRLKSGGLHGKCLLNIR